MYLFYIIYHSRNKIKFANYLLIAGKTSSHREVVPIITLITCYNKEVII